MALLDHIRSLFSGGGKARSGVAAQSDTAVSKRVLFLGGMFVLLIVVMAALFTSATLLSRPNAVYTKIISEQQVISQQIAISAIKASDGSSDGFNRLELNRNRFMEILRMLDLGDSLLDIPPLSAAYDDEYSQMQSAWNSYNVDIDSILDGREVVEKIKEQGTLVTESMPKLIALSEAVMNALEGVEAPRNNILAAARQLALIRGINGNLHQIISGRSTLLVAADQLEADNTEAEILLMALLEGNAALGIRRFTDSKVAGLLLEMVDVFDVANNSINEVLNFSAKLSKVFEASGSIQQSSLSLLTATDLLIERIDTEDEKLSVLSFAGYAFGAAALVFLIMMVLSVVKVSRVQLAESRDQNDKNQRAILRLLDEMTNLADGDLSTHTTVTEDITGAIADSVNYSIDALRDLVGTINKTSVQVSSAVHKTQSTTGQLAEASTAQTREITGASETITTISQSMLDVSEKAADSAEVARKSVSIAHKGGETVRQTIAGMETIREQIQETSKRIKRLGESSQEIGDIVNLITEISDQTNILALNAAIQASMAGEAGRGFAVVADEVQRLAERTGDATKQIEALVKTIQADTNEATVSMEQSTANVVKGAKLTENAGGALDRIEQVSMNLAQRILEISDATKSQAGESVKITQIMDAIQDITEKTSAGSSQASNSIGELTEMVNAMQNSVAGFKLPGMSSADSTMVANVDDLTSFDIVDS